MKKALNKSELMSLRNKILLYTLVPALAVFALAGGIMISSVRSMIDQISENEIFGSTSLSCSRIDALLNDYCVIASGKANRENLKRFLMTAEARDEMEDNAYFSYAIGELDSTISDNTISIDHVWLASSEHPGVAFSNTSAGWTAQEDFDITESFFYSDLLEAGGVFVTDPYISPVTDTAVFTVACAVRDTRTNAMLGVFGISFDMEDLGAKVSSLLINDGNDMMITGSNGVIIYSNDRSLIETDIGNAGLEIVSDNGNIVTFDHNGSRMIGSIEAPENTSWTIYSMRNYGETENMKLYYSRLTILLFIIMGIIIFIAINAGSRKIADPIQDYTKMINELDIHGDEELAEGDILMPKGCAELEHLAVGFNELVKRNHDILNQLKAMNVKSEKERILYQTAIQSSSDVVFEYDIASDELISYGSAVDCSVPKTVTEVTTGFLRSISEGGKYSADDMDSVKAFFSGNNTDEVVIRSNEGEAHWLSFEGTAVFSGEEAVKIVGKIRCIDDVVNLREDARKDLFSGFYNKAATEKIISESLCSVKTGAIVLIDIDNFKKINDLFGHDYGDHVIRDISQKIGSLINEDIIPGRIGGDEFMLYIPNADHKIVTELCGRLCDTIRTEYSCDQSSERVAVSSSIGAALFPVHGNNFEELYRSADIAMYVSKTGGKDKFTVFSGQERPEYKGEGR